MYIYTMGFTQKSAEQFFNKISNEEIQILIDIRLNNQSQLAGFTKGRDLTYFLKEICDCEYEHELKFAPTKELLNGYKKGAMSWQQYEVNFRKIIEERNLVSYFLKKYMKYNKVLLLCSEPTPEFCHRRLLAEAFSENIDYEIRHI